MIIRSTKVRSTKGRLHRREILAFYCMLAPGILGMLIFVVGPIVASFFISLTNWSIIDTPRWIWFENYSQLVNDELFWQSLKVTLLYALGALPSGMVAGMILALLLNQKILGTGVYRTIYYLPAVISGVAAAVLWAYMFNPEYGLFNIVLRVVNIQGPNWLGSSTWVVPAFIIMNLWGAGTSMVIYLAALQGVPKELYEAAIIDGATGWQRIWYITFPCVSPIVFFTLVTGMIACLRVFTQAYVMTEGGPGNASLFYVLYIYRNAFEYLQMGYAAALAWFLFLITILATFVFFRTSHRWVYYEAGR